MKLVSLSVSLDLRKFSTDFNAVFVNIKLFKRKVCVLK